MAEETCQSVAKQKKKYQRSDEPRLIGYYSVDGSRTFLPDSSQLLYFNPPKEDNVYLDLDDGIQSAVRRNEAYEKEGIDLFLEWVKLNHKKFRANPAHGRYLQPKFICTRGTLTRILTSRYSPNDGWIIYAAKWKGSIYLCGDKSKEEMCKQDDKNIRPTSWGFKFEQYVLSDSPDKDPDTSKPVIEPAEFRGVFHRRIGNHLVMFSAVMKGVCSKKLLKDPLPLNELKFIETKTNKIIECTSHERSLRKYKFLRWWAQCYFTNTPEILCGFRDQSGIVLKLERYSVAQIIEMSKAHWDPKACIDFCASFLTTISSKVVDEITESIYKFEKIPDQGINIMKFSSEAQNGFIPASFMEAVG